jgi:hypothetical protein
MGLIGRLFGGSRPPESNVFHGLRNRALTVTAPELGLEPDPAAPIHGVIMETGYPEAVATFVCLRDGAVSLYLSTGGGVIGGGQDESERAACLEMLQITRSVFRALQQLSGRTVGSAEGRGRPLSLLGLSPADGRCLAYSVGTTHLRGLDGRSPVRPAVV